MAPQCVLLATTNPAKEAKLRWLLEGLGVVCLAPASLLGRVEAEESDTSFRENAEGKARACSRQTRDLVIASDGGAVVPVLGDRWNALLTRRMAGSDADDVRRAEHLLELMRPYRGEQRRVFWTEAVAIAHRGEVLALWEVTGNAGYLAESFAPARFRPGFWLANLWWYPHLGKVYRDLDEAELAEVDTTWNELRERVHAWFREFGLLRGE